MADLIDRDAHIKKVCAECGVCGRYWGRDAKYKCNEIERILNAPAVNCWIKCSEQLPNENCMVLICIYGSDLIMTQDGETLAEAVERIRRECVSVTVGFIGSDGWYGEDWMPLMVQPTYWMPLPAAPECSLSITGSAKESALRNGKFRSKSRRTSRFRKASPKKRGLKCLLVRFARL